MGGEGNAGGYLIAPRYWAWLGTRRGASVLLWLVALGVGTYFLVHAHIWFDVRSTTPEYHRRADGNGGHAQIDFGGQWVMARMLVLGHGRELYHRQRQWEVVRDSFPVADESPASREESIVPPSQRSPGVPKEMDHDANLLMFWFVGSDPPEWKTVGGAAVAPLGQDLLGNPLFAVALELAATDAVTPAVVGEVTKPAIGGALYPPVQALLYAPLALIDRPQTAYHVAQVFGAAMVVVAALGVTVLSRGKIPLPLAIIVLFLFPGTRGGLDLGQNPTLSLAIVVWGWALASRGYQFAGGAVWGLFAFKPVWGLAFFVIPVLMRRWRFCLGTAVAGLALVAATIPFVGVQSWLDWLQVGKRAAVIYNMDYNWIHLSRDVQSVPRRILHDFSLPREQRETKLAAALGWLLWAGIFATTAAVYLRKGDRSRATGVGAAFLFLGAVLTCYRFMYYDSLLAAAGCAVLFAEPARFFRTRVFDLTLVPQSPNPPLGRQLPRAAAPAEPFGPRMFGYVSSFPLTILVCFLVYESALSGLKIEATVGVGYFSYAKTGADGETAREIPKTIFDTGMDYPWETAMTFALWAWCGWRLLRGDESAPAAGGSQPSRPSQSEISASSEPAN